MRRKNESEDHGFTKVSIGQLSATILGTVFWLALAVILHPVAYGNLSWLVSIATVSATICTLGLGKTLTAFYPEEEDGGLLGSSSLLVLITGLTGGAIVSILMRIWVQDLMAAFTGVLVFSLSLFSISFYSELARKNYTNYMWMWIGVRTSSLILPLLIYNYWGLVAGILAGLSGGYLIFGSWTLTRINRGNGLESLRGKLGFSLKSLGSDIGRVAINFADKIIIGSLFSLAVLGVYQFAFRIFVLLGVLPNALFFYLLPEKSSGMDTRKLEAAGLVLSGLLAAVVFFLAPGISSRIFPGFGEGTAAIRIMGLAVVPATGSRIISAGIFSEKRPRIVLGSRFLALGVGIVGIVLTFNNSFGLTGLAYSLLALQVTLLFSLVAIPKLLESGEKGSLILSAIGMGVVTALLISSISIHSMRVSRVGEDELQGAGLAMDTNVKITVIEDGTGDAERAIRRAFEEIKRVEDLMSTEKRGSEVYELNHSGDNWVELSPEVIGLLDRSKLYSEKTGGAFDPTAEPLVDFWMKKTKREGKMPDNEEISGFLRLVDWGSLLIEENRVRFEKAGMKVTLGGIAKGYAIDRACEILLEEGVENALVEAGGDMRAVGSRSWKVGVQDPRNEGGVIETFELKNEAVATSGDYRRYYWLGSERIHHIIDPKTGRPADESMSATVVADNCLAADALSTGVFVAGPENGRNMLESLDASGLMVDRDGSVYKTYGWPSVENHGDNKPGDPNSRAS